MNYFLKIFLKSFFNGIQKTATKKLNIVTNNPVTTAITPPPKPGPMYKNIILIFYYSTPM